MSETLTSIIEDEAASSGIRRGMVFIAAGATIAPGMHAIAKGLGDSLSFGQIAWARFFFQLTFLLPVVLISYRGRLPRPAITHGVRGLLLVLATLAFFWAVTFMPLADSAAIFFAEPLILTVMSALFLGEQIGWRRVLAVLVGFMGALIVIRPSFETFGLPALLPLLAAVCYALYLIMTRRLAKTESAQAMQFWVCLFGMLILSALLAASAQIGWDMMQPSWPTIEAWGWLACLGVIATIAHMLAIRAFQLAPASVLAPFQYLEILGATLLGAVIFDDLPDGLTGLGIAIVVGSGLYVFYREQQTGAKPSPTEG
ncbi:MAG: DMT family transporter [Geminicoccaceae bacterium]